MPKRRELTGQRFGRLTVIENTGRIEDQYTVWRCRCDCGKEVLVNTRRLLRGTVSSCGCTPKSTARRGAVAEDLTGRRFGHLTVLYQEKSRKGRACWTCRCDCGNLHVATAHALKSGKCKSCGCQHYTGKHNQKNIANRRFGRLVALFPTEKRDRKGCIYWHCRCDCGTELDVTLDRLVYGDYRSCGCLKKELQASINETLTFVDGTCVEWIEKRKSRCDNTSGFRGVYHTSKGNYRVSIGFQKQRYYVGTYPTFEQAVQARLKAEELIHNGFLKAYRLWSDQAKKEPLWAKKNPFRFQVEKKDGSFSVLTNATDFEHTR